MRGNEAKEGKEGGLYGFFWDESVKGGSLGWATWSEVEEDHSTLCDGFLARRIFDSSLRDIFEDGRIPILSEVSLGEGGPHIGQSVRC